MAATRRITKEYSDLQNDEIPGVVMVKADENNLLQWEVKLAGPADSPYKGGVFRISLIFPVEYPFKGPVVKFLTKIYHMNIMEDGNICIGLLKGDAWKPSTKVDAILRALIQMLQEPNTDDALVPSISEQYRNDRKKHDAEAKAWTKKHAMD